MDSPPDTLSIKLRCDSQLALSEQPKQVHLTLIDDVGGLYQESVNYTLACVDAPTPPDDAPTPPTTDLTVGALITPQTNYTVMDDITVAFAISRDQQMTPIDAVIGIFAEGALSVSCDENTQPIATRPILAANGEAVFQPLPAGGYQAQILDADNCHIGAPIRFVVHVPQATFFQLRNTTDGYQGTDDTNVARIGPLHDAPQGAVTEIEADGSDPEDGETAILVRWTLPDEITGTVNTVSLGLEITNPSEGSYGIYATNTPWDEDSAVWDSVNLSLNQGQLLLGEVVSPAVGPVFVSLNATGVAIVQSWIDDLVPNYGFVIRAINTEDDIKIRTSEYQIEGRRPLLELTTEESVAAPQGTNNSPIVWSTHTSKCLDVSAGGTANGTNILLWDCNASNANQKFNYDPQTEQIIWATHTNKCLDVRAGGTANGTNIQLWDCNASNANQKFNM
jgi:hypothetical protein